MKNIKRVLFIFILLFSSILFVDAKEAYSMKWEAENSQRFYTTFWDAVPALENMVYVFGEGEGFNSDYSTVIVKYKDYGAYSFPWYSTYRENHRVFKAVKDGDEIIHLSYLSDYDSMYLMRFDDEFSQKWSKELNIEETVSYYNVPYVTMSLSKNVLGISFNNLVYLYDTEGNLIKELCADLTRPGITLNESGIYVVGKDGNNNLVLRKYDYDNYSLIDTKTIYSSSNILMNDIQTNGNNIMISLTNREIIILDMNMNLVDSVVVDVEVVEIEPDVNGFYIIGKYTGNNGNGRYQSALMKYTMNLDKEWEIIQSTYTPYGITIINGDVVVCGEKEGYYGYVVRYTPPKYDVVVKTDENGEVTVSSENGVEGDEIEFVVTPKEGYRIKTIVVKTSTGDIVEVQDNKFKMPSEDVEVSVEFELIPDEEEVPPTIPDDMPNDTPEEIPDNPNTGVTNSYIIFFMIIILSSILLITLNRKKYI